MRIWMVALVLFALGIAPAAAVAPAFPAVPTALRPGIDALVEPLIRDRWLAGAVVAIIRPGHTELASYGTTGGASPRTPDGDTLFQLASVSKTFSAIVLADAVRAGQVRLEDPVAMHLPAGPAVPSFEGHPVTLEHLATHHSGIPSDPPVFPTLFDPDPYFGYDVPKLREAIATVTLSQAPGTAYQYSNMGTSLMAAAVAHRAGTGFPELLRARVTGPLGMTGTHVGFAGDPARWATGHDSELRPTAHWSASALAPAGGIVSSVNDMTRFVRAQLDPPAGPLGEAIAATHAVRRTIAPGLGIGLSWHVFTDDGVVWHNGAIDGFRTWCGFRKDFGVGVVILTNTGSYIVDKVGMRLMQLAAGETPHPLTVPAEAPSAPLGDFTGRYEWDRDSGFTIAHVGDTLRLTIDGQPSRRIWSAGADRFFLRVVEASVTFVRAADGRVTAAVFRQGGVESTAHRTAR